MEIEKPLVVVVVVGLLSSVPLTLFVMLVFYAWQAREQTEANASSA